MLGTQGWSGAHCTAKSSATSSPSAAAPRDKAAETGERAELGMDRAVAALGRADRVRAAGIAGRGREGVVAALAVDAADRMDRRQIDHVEAHRRDLGQPRDAIVEGGALRRGAALAAWKHLVPRGKAREPPVDDHLELAR